MNMHGWTISMNKNYGHAAWTWSTGTCMDKQHGHEACLVYLKEISFVVATVSAEYTWLKFDKFRFDEISFFYRIRILPDLTKILGTFHAIRNLTFRYANVRWPPLVRAFVSKCRNEKKLTMPEPVRYWITPTRSGFFCSETYLTEIMDVPMLIHNPCHINCITNPWKSLDESQNVKLPLTYIPSLLASKKVSQFWCVGFTFPSHPLPTICPMVLLLTSQCTDYWSLLMSPNCHYSQKQHSMYSPYFSVLFKGLRCTPSGLLYSWRAAVLLWMYCCWYRIFNPVLCIWELRWSYSSLYIVLVIAFSISQLC